MIGHPGASLGLRNKTVQTEGSTLGVPGVRPVAGADGFPDHPEGVCGSSLPPRARPSLGSSSSQAVRQSEAVGQSPRRSATAASPVRASAWNRFRGARMQLAKPKARRWSYAEYSRLTDLGFFDRQRVELIGGRIIQMAAQRDVHTAAVSLARDAVAAAFGPGYWVRVQAPLHMGRWSGPEPDVSVVPGSARDYVGTGHPKSALLVVEVSDTTLRFDRRVKQGMYAKYDIQHYWIVNPVDWTHIIESCPTDWSICLFSDRRGTSQRTHQPGT